MDKKKYKAIIEATFPESWTAKEIRDLLERKIWGRPFDIIKFGRRRGRRR